MAVGSKSFTDLEIVFQVEDNVLPLNWWLLLINKYYAHCLMRHKDIDPRNICLLLKFLY